MKTTLVSIANEYGKSVITLDEAVEAARRLDFPEHVVSDYEDNYYIGENENTWAAVRALIPESLSVEQFHKFQETFSNESDQSHNEKDTK